MPAVERREDPAPGASRCERPERRSSGGRHSSSRGTVFRQRPIPTTKSPGTTDAWGLTLRDLRRHRRGDGDRARGTGSRRRLRRRSALEIRCARCLFRWRRRSNRVKPMWLEDLVRPGTSKPWPRVTHAVDIPICTGENLYTCDGFRRLIELQACDIVHIDIPKSGGLMEAKAHSRPGGQLLHCDRGPQSRRARSARSPRATPPPPCAISGVDELATLHRPVARPRPSTRAHVQRTGDSTIQTSPYGIEINPDVAKG